MFQTVNVKISWSLLTFCKWTHAVVVRVHLHLFCWKLISSQQCSTLSAGLNIRGEKFHRILKCKLTISGSQGPSVQSPKLLGVFWGEVSTHLPYSHPIDDVGLLWWMPDVQFSYTSVLFSGVVVADFAPRRLLLASLEHWKGRVVCLQKPV